jgi:hypothetical protein
VPTIFAANESRVEIGGTPVEGVRALDYRRVQNRGNVFALGTAERIGVVSGPQVIEGRLRVASTAPPLDGITGDGFFQVIAKLVHGQTQMELVIDECFLMEKTFEIGVGGVGETVYTFTATRVRESPAAT